MTARQKPLKYEPCYLKSESGNPLTKFVNLCQSAEERRDKYRYCRFFGLSSRQGMRMRDWHWTKINLFIQTLQNPPATA